MSNGEVCCILGICCPPASAKQREKLVEFIIEHSTCDAASAKLAAGVVLEHFDLAPAGTLRELMAVVRQQAKHLKDEP